MSCRQIGPIDVDLAKLKEGEEVFTQKTSIFFQKTRIYRMIDKPHNTLIYLCGELENRQRLAVERHQHRKADHAVGEVVRRTMPLLATCG